MHLNNTGRSLDKALAIYYCGYENCDKDHFFGPAIRRQYLLHFVISGKGEYKVNNKVYPIKQGQIFIIKPLELTYYNADKDDPWEYMWVAFDGINAKEILKKIGLENSYVTSTTNPEDFKHYINLIIDEFNSGRNNDFKILGCFYGAMSQLENSTRILTFEEEYFTKATSYIKNNYSYPIKISDIAKYVGIDRTYLYKIFMSEEQISPKQYLINTRISAAKNMLRTEAYSVNEIALSCGFSDSSSFCNHFKKVQGLTPKDFKKKIFDTMD